MTAAILVSLSFFFLPQSRSEAAHERGEKSASESESRYDLLARVIDRPLYCDYTLVNRAD